MTHPPASPSLALSPGAIKRVSFGVAGPDSVNSRYGYAFWRSGFEGNEFTLFRFVEVADFIAPWRVNRWTSDTASMCDAIRHFVDRVSRAASPSEFKILEALAGADPVESAATAGAIIGVFGRNLKCFGTALALGDVLFMMRLGDFGLVENGEVLGAIKKGGPRVVSMMAAIKKMEEEEDFNTG